ncbi:MAG: recombinase RecA [Planctomycetaceae bacterium]|jgi:KaiC/GvpD/RAD55 family RecA-like ATPase|nr:recombinase RecA [Planctomycetaceae bacterium]
MTNNQFELHRQSTGISGLDQYLGGGLLPGTMTVLVGSSGIGKTQFGIQYAHAGLQQEGQRGVLFDMASRGDPQGHKEYAQRLFQWILQEEVTNDVVDYEHFFDKKNQPGDYFRALTYQGKRVTKRDMDFDQWNDWQAELSKHLDATIAYFFGHFIRGRRRFVVDGIEPVQHQGESIQFELLEYVYHQIIRKDAEWVARDLFRQHFRGNETKIRQHLYRKEEIGCLVNYTSSETSLDTMIEKPLDEGDLLANANTIIYMGKIRDGNKFRRAMYVSKHRGSPCPDEILLYNIDEHGLKIVTNGCEK